MGQGRRLLLLAESRAQVVAGRCANTLAAQELQSWSIMAIVAVIGLLALGIYETLKVTLILKYILVGLRGNSIFAVFVQTSR